MAQHSKASCPELWQRVERSATPLRYWGASPPETATHAGNQDRQSCLRAGHSRRPSLQGASPREAATHARDWDRQSCHASQFKTRYSSRASGSSRNIGNIGPPSASPVEFLNGHNNQASLDAKIHKLQRTIIRGGPSHNAEATMLVPPRRKSEAASKWATPVNMSKSAFKPVAESALFGEGVSLHPDDTSSSSGCVSESEADALPLRSEVSEPDLAQNIVGQVAECGQTGCIEISDSEAVSRGYTSSEELSEGELPHQTSLEGLRAEPLKEDSPRAAVGVYGSDEHDRASQNIYASGARPSQAASPVPCASAVCTDETGEGFERLRMQQRNRCLPSIVRPLAAGDIAVGSEAPLRQLQALQDSLNFARDMALEQAVAKGKEFAQAVSILEAAQSGPLSLSTQHRSRCSWPYFQPRPSSAPEISLSLAPHLDPELSPPLPPQLALRSQREPPRPSAAPRRSDSPQQQLVKKACPKPTVSAPESSLPWARRKRLRAPASTIAPSTFEESSTKSLKPSPSSSHHRCPLAGAGNPTMPLPFSARNTMQVAGGERHLQVYAPDCADLPPTRLCNFGKCTCVQEPITMHSTAPSQDRGAPRDDAAVATASDVRPVSLSASKQNHPSDHKKDSDRVSAGSPRKSVGDIAVLLGERGGSERMPGEPLNENVVSHPPPKSLKGSVEFLGERGDERIHDKPLNEDEISTATPTDSCWPEHHSTASTESASPLDTEDLIEGLPVQVGELADNNELGSAGSLRKSVEEALQIQDEKGDERMHDECSLPKSIGEALHIQDEKGDERMCDESLLEDVSSAASPMSSLVVDVEDDRPKTCQPLPDVMSKREGALSKTSNLREGAQEPASVTEEVQKSKVSTRMVKSAHNKLSLILSFTAIVHVLEQKSFDYELDTADDLYSLPAGDGGKAVYIKFRPWARRFLTELLPFFDIMIVTSSDFRLVNFVMDVLDPPGSVLCHSANGQNKMLPVDQCHIPDNIIVFDDEIETWKYQNHCLHDRLTIVRAYPYRFLKHVAQQQKRSPLRSGAIPPDYDLHLQCAGHLLRFVHSEVNRKNVSIKDSINGVWNCLLQGVRIHFLDCVVQGLPASVKRYGGSVVADLNPKIHVVVVDVPDPRQKMIDELGLVCVSSSWLILCWASFHLQDPRPFIHGPQVVVQTDIWGAYELWRSGNPSMRPHVWNPDPDLKMRMDQDVERRIASQSQSFERMEQVNRLSMRVAEGVRG